MFDPAARRRGAGAPLGALSRHRAGDPARLPGPGVGGLLEHLIVEEVPPIDFLRLYIPANPFHLMANTLVPAVVLFSIALGVAVIGSENKWPIIQALDLLADALMKLTGFG